MQAVRERVRSTPCAPYNGRDAARTAQCVAAITLRACAAVIRGAICGAQLSFVVMLGGTRLGLARRHIYIDR
jgi:hypothetical protein